MPHKWQLAQGMHIVRSMRAALLHEIGGRLTIGEVDDPVPTGEDILVDVSYASVNPLDIWISRGAPGTAASHLPWIPGTEGAGFHNGRPVLIRGGGLGVVRHGVFSSKAVVPPAALISLAEGTDLVAASAVGVAGLTAWHCVHSRGGCTAQDRVLVLGASGGVGSLAVQLARATGATVWGQSTNPAKSAAIETLGADRVVVSDDSQLVDAVAELKPTLVIDGLGGRYTAAAVDALQPFGRLVLFGASSSDDIPLTSRAFYRKGLTMLGYTGLLDPQHEQATLIVKLLDMVRAGSLTIQTELLPLSQAAEAFDRILDRRVQGKLVLDTAR
jgi:NADPH:quinone reductase